MSLIDIQISESLLPTLGKTPDKTSETNGKIPATEHMITWVQAALPDAHKQAEVCVRIIDENESQALNHQYRNKDYPTNVLSFPADIPEDVGISWLGDIAICASIVEKEAQEQQKNPIAHWAHMIVHGTLHLCGYDHIDTDDADIMESLETKLMISLGFSAPYEDITL